MTGNPCCEGSAGWNVGLGLGDYLFDPIIHNTDSVNAWKFERISQEEMADIPVAAEIPSKRSLVTVFLYKFFLR